jgi:hypothetical protein
MDKEQAHNYREQRKSADFLLTGLLMHGFSAIDFYEKYKSTIDCMVGCYDKEKELYTCEFPANAQLADLMIKLPGQFLELVYGDTQSVQKKQIRLSLARNLKEHPLPALALELDRQAFTRCEYC